MIIQSDYVKVYFEFYNLGHIEWNNVYFDEHHPV